jgi:hypothetical protein
MTEELWMYLFALIYDIYLGKEGMVDKKGKSYFKIRGRGQTIHEVSRKRRSHLSDKLPPIKSLHKIT